MLQTNQGRAAHICSHASSAFCWDTRLPHKMFKKEKSSCWTLGGYPGAECMLLMGINLEDIDFEMHFSNNDSCLQVY